MANLMVGQVIILNDGRVRMENVRFIGLGPGVPMVDALNECTLVMRNCWIQPYEEPQWTGEVAERWQGEEG